MALSKARAASDRRVRPARTAPNTGFVPVDAVYEILLRVPSAKDLCRFRAVCRPWRSLLSDPDFITAHAARHPGPLIVASNYTNSRKHGILCDIMDLSGRVLKQIRRSTSVKNEWVVFTQLDLIGTKAGDSESFRILNPANGAVYALPGGLAEEHARLDRSAYRALIAFGQVASTGEYKVLRVLDNLINMVQWCEVSTLDGTNSIHSPWRAKDNPTNTLDPHSRLVMDGIVYFLSIDKNLLFEDAANIASFDLETEEWRASILGPQINNVGDAIGMHSNHYDADLSMAALSGSLVVVHCFHSSVDLWFLADFEKGLWVLQHSIRIKESVHRGLHIRPLLVLNDGRIVTYIQPWGVLRVYNPKTSAYTDVAEIGSRLGIGLYTGNLLSLANGTRK